jgi:uncharacterized protein YndB with AHSA1/START domain
MSYPTFQKERIIRAPIDKVWQAVTNPEKIKSYLYGTDVTSSFQEGSPIRFTGVYEEKGYEDKGTILKFQPNKVFSYSYWSSMSGIPDVPENYAAITFELEAHGNQTRLTLSQANSPTQSMYEHSQTGWDHSLDIIEDLVK